MAVGKTGAVVSLALPKTFLFPKKHSDYVYDRYTPATSGGLANAMIRWPGAVRSLHPYNCCIEIGSDTGNILKGHDENATCFFPMEKLFERDSKMILLGCVEGFVGVQHGPSRTGPVGINDLNKFFSKISSRVYIFAGTMGGFSFPQEKRFSRLQ